MSSMDKEIMKIFLKVHSVGAKYFNKDVQENPKEPRTEKLTNK
jgi:hypothetical protein